MTATFRFRTGAVTDVGGVRKVNEDALVSRPEAALWAVADGMGGHDNGRFASGALAAELEKAALDGGFDEDAQAVGDAIAAANAAIFAAAREAGKSMGSTVVALFLAGPRFGCLWAGDSRAYLKRGEQLHRLTRDHTQVQDMVERGLLTAEEARSHPMSHVLSRAVGVGAQLQLDAVADEAAPGDVFLLCSDGLTGVVADAEIAERLAQDKPEIAAQRLVELCLSRGAPDNVTVVVVACEETTSLALSPALAQA